MMSKKYLSVIAVVSAFVITVGVAQAYPHNTLFGTGYGFAGYNNFNNGYATTDVTNRTMKEYSEAEKSERAVEGAYKDGEKPVSDITGYYDEAPNAGYKTHYTYIEKGSDDYNPYTGANSGVNGTKSIYVDDLGRIHFFGKGSLFRTDN